MSTTSTCPPLIFFSLTPEDDDDIYPQSPQDYEEPITNWMEDSECQENLFQIVSLTPEETIIDKDNHLSTSYQLFFEELGYLTEEPEPIDPTRDYEQEARELQSRRENKRVVRQKHIELSNAPSLDYSSISGISSSSSSIHHEHHLIDIRSPHYMGGLHHPHTSSITADAYHYGTDHKQYHHNRPSRLH